MSTAATSTATALRSSSLTAILLLLASMFLTLDAAKASPPSSCSDELVRFSPCLSYVASPPNNLSDSPASKCCEVFSSAAESGSAVCLCYLVQDPPMLGFPVTIARVLSLSSVCPRRNSTSADTTSLESLCSESPELPPLRNTTAPVIPSPPPPSGHHETASSPSPKLAHNSSTKPSSLTPPSFSSTPPNSAVGPARLPSSSTTSEKRFFKNNTSWFIPAISFFILF